MARRHADEAVDVDGWLAGLKHPRMQEIQALRRLVMSVSPAIAESIKWNAPSYALGEHFATLRLAGRPSLQLILHLGAKKSQIPKDAVEDPSGLLEWRGPDRAIVSFERPGGVEAVTGPLEHVLRQWIRFVPARS